MGSARVVHTVVLAASLLGLSRTVRAQPKTFSLNWVREAGAESCIASHALANLIEQTLGPVFAAPGDAELSIEAKVGRAADDTGWSARIVVSDRRGAILGERTIASHKPSCRALDPEVVLVIVLAIDPEVALEHLPAELLTQLQSDPDAAADLLVEVRAHAEPALSDPPAPVVHESAQPLSAHDTAPPARMSEVAGTVPRRRHTAALSFGAALGAGALPKLSTGPSLRLGLGLSRPWSLSFGGVLWLDNEATLAVATARGNTVHFAMAAASISFCGTLIERDAIDWTACAGGALGLRWIAASALLKPVDRKRWDGGPVLSTEVGWATFYPMQLSIVAAAEPPLYRERFTYRDQAGMERVLFVPGALSVYAALYVGLLL